MREKIIFLHIPKTAGSSLRQIVEQEYPGDDCLSIYTHRTPEFLASIQEDVPKAKAIYGHFSYGIHEFLGIHGRYVTFVRNPINRVLSYYSGH